MPSKDSNTHNPAIDADSIKRLQDIRWAKHMTWREFYRWLTPLAEHAHATESAQTRPQAGLEAAPVAA